MLVYPTWVGRLLGGGALLLFTILLLRVRARHLLTLRDVLAAGAWNCLAVAVGVLAALLPALVVKVFLHRAIGWFSAPALLLACSAIPSAAGTLFIHGWWRAHALRKMAGDIERVALTAWMGSLVFWAFWLLLATVRGVGAGYLPLYWVAGGSLGLLVARRFSRARLAAALLGLVLGAVPTIEIATMFVVNIVPMSGLVPAKVPADMVIVALVALSTTFTVGSSRSPYLVARAARQKQRAPARRLALWGSRSRRRATHPTHPFIRNVWWLCMRPTLGKAPCC